MSAGMLLTLAVYSIAHGMVDGACAATLFDTEKRRRPSPGAFWGLVVGYDVLAFAGQPLFGWAADTWQAPRVAAVVGCLMVAGAVVLSRRAPWVAMGLAGLGNAVFHVGGGAIALNLTPNAAMAPGIFVAPGALGLTLGGELGKRGKGTGWPSPLMLVAACLAMGMVSIPPMDYQPSTPAAVPAYAWGILALLLFSISVRSLIALAVAFPWKSSVALLAVFTVATAGGKACGGILADRFGWLAVAVTALLASAPLLSFGATRPLLAIPGMFLFQMTMPVTLVAIAMLLPGRPAFAFGVASLALVVGAFPTFTGLKSVFGGRWWSLVLILSAAAALCIALRLLLGPTAG